MYKYPIICLTISTFLCGIVVGHLTANKISKKIETTQTVTTESKKQEVSVVQVIQKDSTAVKETTREIVSYSSKGKVRKREFVETKYGAKAKIGTQEFIKNNVLDLSSSVVNSTTVTEYRSNWAVLANYELTLDSSILTWKPQNLEFGVGYRLVGDLYGTAQTNAIFNMVKVGGIYLIN